MAKAKRQKKTFNDGVNAARDSYRAKLRSEIRNLDDDCPYANAVKKKFEYLLDWLKGSVKRNNARKGGMGRK